MSTSTSYIGSSLGLINCYRLIRFPHPVCLLKASILCHGPVSKPVSSKASRHGLEGFDMAQVYLCGISSLR